MLNNKPTFSVRIHGYGGQGIKTIANILAKSAIASGIYAQAFPEFGPERRGAPVKAYARFSIDPILTRSQISKPDFAIIMDTNTLGMEITKEGLDEKSCLLLQTDLEPKVAKEKFSLLPDYHRIYCIDSTSVIAEYDNNVHISIPVIARFVRITELIPIDIVKEVSRKEFIEKIGEKKASLMEKALEETYYQV